MLLLLQRICLLDHVYIIMTIEMLFTTSSPELIIVLLFVYLVFYSFLINQLAN